jgi:two-component system, NarL family, nitrate/nitrite response regulator NarL
VTAATRARRQAPEVIAASASDDLPRPIRVVIVHSVRLYREALADLLHREGRVEVVGTAASLRGADEVTRELAPDVCLVGLGAMDELDTVREFAQALPAVKLVALGVGETTAEVIAWAEAGIHGFVTQDGEVDSCIAAIEAAAHGSLTCSETVAAVLLRRVAELAATLADGSRPDHVLTRREFEILELIGQDLSNKEIAARLFIEVTTVKNHVHKILEKLGVHRRSEAATLVREFDSTRARGGVLNGA